MFVMYYIYVVFMLVILDITNIHTLYYTHHMELHQSLIDNKIINTINNNIRYKRLIKFPELVDMVIAATQFLEYDASTDVRLVCVVDNITSQPVCPSCSKILKMRMSGAHKRTFADMCASCVAKTQITQDKKRATTRERYGVDFAQQSEGVSNKIKLTNLERYGVENVLSSPKIREQTKITMMERYGVEYALQSQDSRDKMESTNLKRYGAVNVATVSSITTTKKSTNLELYGSEWPLGSSKIKDTIKMTMMERYGVEYPSLSPQIRAKQVKALMEHYGITNPAELADNEAGNKVKFHQQLHLNPSDIAKMYNRDWLINEHITNKRTLTDISKELGYSIATISRVFTEFDIPVQNHHTSIGEDELYKFIQSHIQSDIIIIRNDRLALDGLELDIYIPSLNIAFEYNGVFWHSELVGKDKNYHITKTKMCEDLGIRLVHISDHEWNNDTTTKDMILTILGCVGMINATDCIIEYQHFNETTIDYTLIYEDITVAMLSIRLMDGGRWGINDYVTGDGVDVINGFTRLFEAFIYNTNPDVVVSVVNLLCGSMYPLLDNNFNWVERMEPSCQYFENGKDGILFVREDIPDNLEYHDPNLSDWENVVSNGYNRIWDCGYDVYEWNSVLHSV